MKNIVLAIFFLFVINNVNAQSTTLKENGFWFIFSNKVTVSKKVYFENIFQMRRVNFSKNTQVLIVRPSFNFRLNENVSLGAGYMYFKSYPNGVYHSSIKKEETRLWQHITLNSVIWNVKFSNRFIFEERFKDVINTTVTPNVIEGTSYLQRFRYRILASFNLFKLNNNNHYILGKISNEIRIRFNNGLSQLDFDQNNFVASLGYKILDNSTVWIGYGRDYYKVNSDKFVLNNILQMNLNYDFDFTKKK